ncbi:NDP-sugar synthase [Promicromonospora sukumoe]|uniref:NDP-sugar synthase n=1 Tax=Promicromonospora sukumoe TaxID=88382 RepID=UPI0037C76FD5
MQIEHAIVLCGGRGSRLGPLGQVVHKALLPVAGAPLISHVLANLVHGGVKHITILAGHRSDQLKEYLRAARPDVTSLDFVDEVGAGTAASVRAVASRFTGDFIYAHGNVLVPHHAVEKLRVEHAGDPQRSASFLLSPRLVAPTHPRAKLAASRITKFTHDGSGEVSSVGLAVLNRQVLAPSATGPENLTTEMSLNEAIAAGQRVMGTLFDDEWLHLEDLSIYSSIGTEIAAPGGGHG